MFTLYYGNRRHSYVIKYCYKPWAYSYWQIKSKHDIWLTSYLQSYCSLRYLSTKYWTILNNIIYNGFLQIYLECRLFYRHRHLANQFYELSTNLIQCERTQDQIYHSLTYSWYPGVRMLTWLYSINNHELNIYQSCKVEWDTFISSSIIAAAISVV